MLRTNTQTAPLLLLSFGPSTIAVLLSELIATVFCKALAIAPEPINLFPCLLHATLTRVKTQAAPALLLSVYPEKIKVLPSALIETELPCPALPTAPVPTNLLPCCYNELLLLPQLLLLFLLQL